ncbi:Thiamin-phosphate pyrophosphorylase [hydrothermal vent metagenome]|uniref:thiamine phosphate synthase n=1 Tax=hydrothermal vent metagenome TaxID=652676 RepID=A0A3B1DZV5_9ZZZZ
MISGAPAFNQEITGKNMLYGGICFITDSSLSALSVEETVRRVLDAGVRWIQYREKALCRKDIFLQAERLRRLTNDYKAILTVNDHADIALAVDADGVHLGQDDLPLKAARKIMGKKIIGISTHDMNQAKVARRNGADYIGFGPVFQTSTKDAGTPRGLDLLRDVVSSIDIPVVAIGGINLKNLGDVMRHGASAVAVASGILKSPDVCRTARDFVNIIYAEI